jgi:outer membrane usher protein
MILTATCWPSTSHAADQRAFLNFTVNGIACGIVVAIVRPSDVLLQPRDLEKAGLNLDKVRRITIGKETFVSLAALAPAFAYKFNQRTLAIAVTASASSFNPTSLDLTAGAPKDMVFQSNPAGFLNYSVTTSNFDSLSGFFEGGVSLDQLLFYSGLVLDNTSDLIRGLTNVTWDDRKDMRRLTLGDIALNAPVLGGGPFIGGLTLQKNFSLDPYFIHFPTQSISGSVTSPSTAYVYRNGVLIRQVRLAPGQFNLSQIPGLSGVSNTQVVIRNAFGGSQVINAPFYAGATLLRPGLSSYQYSVGELRNNVGTTSWEYGPLALSANHDLGLTSWFTPGYRLEATGELISGGPEFTIGLPFGIAQLALAASADSHQGSGAAASFFYQYISPGIGADMQFQWMSPHYANLSLPPTLDRPIIQENSSISYNYGKLALGLQHIYSRERDATGGDSVLHQILATLFFTLSERLSLSVTLGHALPGNELPANEAFVGLSYYLGNTTTAMVSYTHQQSESSAVGSLQKGLPYGPGYGYLLQAQGGSNGSQQQAAMFQYQTNKGYYEGDYYHLGDQDSGSLTAAGGIIAIGQRVFLTRPVQNGFALVRVPGVRHVECEWSNQPVGTTDKNGDCLYPNLLPYYGNQIGIDERDIPLNYSVGATQKVVAVPYRGGTVIKFPVHKIHQIIGKLTVIAGSKKIIPADGQITLDSKPKEVSPIGDGGEFYFEDVPIGTFRALVEYKGGTCSFDLVVPRFEEPLHNMGNITCGKQ